MTEGNQPEPSGYELMRGIERLEKQLKDLASGFVTAAVFEIFVKRFDEDRDASAKRHASLEKKLEEETKARIESDDNAKARAEEVKKFRAQTYISFAVAGLALLTNIFGGAIRQFWGLP